MTTAESRQEELVPEKSQPVEENIVEVPAGGVVRYGQSEDGRLWRDLLTAAAHEIRNPLNALRGQLQLAADSITSRPDLPPDLVNILSDYLSRAIASASRIRRLIDDLTEVGFASGGMLQLECKWLDLVAVIREVIQRTRTSEDLCPPIVLRSPEALLGLWDRMRVEQVVSNLLDNAIRFCNGQPIEIEAYADAGTAHIKVRDHGIGIPAAALERIFRPFQSAGTPSRSHPGLGLWVVRQALAAMNGSITVSSKVGEGSTFWVQIPIK